LASEKERSIAGSYKGEPCCELAALVRANGFWSMNLGV
jgi:hypothetical protein